MYFGLDTTRKSQSHASFLAIGIQFFFFFLSLFVLVIWCCCIPFIIISLVLIQMPFIRRSFLRKMSQMLNRWKFDIRLVIFVSFRKKNAVHFEWIWVDLSKDDDDKHVVFVRFSFDSIDASVSIWHFSFAVSKSLVRILRSAQNKRKTQRNCWCGILRWKALAFWMIFSTVLIIWRCSSWLPIHLKIGMKNCPHQTNRYLSINQSFHWNISLWYSLNVSLF